MDKLCSISKYFCLFDNLESIYNDLIEKSYIISCDIKNFKICVSIEELSFTTIDFIIPIIAMDNQNLTESIQILAAPLSKIESSILKRDQFYHIKESQSSIVPFITDEELQLPLKHLNKNVSNLRLLNNPCSETDTKEVYHDCCDTNYPLIVFIETNCGTRFGGYTSVGWDPVVIQLTGTKKITCNILVI